MEEALRAIEAFKRQTALDDRFEQYMPADDFSNFALHLAGLYKASDMSQTTVAAYFNEMYDFAQGKKAATLFEEADTNEYPLAEVIKKVVGIDYKPAKNGNNNVENGGADVALRNQESQGGHPRGNEPPASGGQDKTGTEPSERGGGAGGGSEVAHKVISPVATGVFGDVYDNFKGKANEAFEFLLSRGSGDLLGVFHRDEVGDIDVVWGDDGGGFAHIVSKHVGKGKSFDNILAAAHSIKTIISKGKIDFENGDKIVFRKGSEIVTIRKNFRKDGKKIADKNWVLTAYDEMSADGGVSAVAPTNKGQAARTTGKSRGKVTNNQRDGQADGKKSDGAAPKTEEVDGRTAAIERLKALSDEELVSFIDHNGDALARDEDAVGVISGELQRRGIDERRIEEIRRRVKEREDTVAGTPAKEDGKPRLQKAEADVRADKREAALRDALVDRLRGAGLDVSMDAGEGQRVLDEVNGRARMSAKKRRALETASVSREEKHQQTVISSADGAKVLKNLDSLANDYENSQHTKEKTFLGETAKALGAERHGSASEYATFETKNGRIVTIRLANHNARVSNFDNRGESEGISIVVSPRKSDGMTNDGNAHVVEYYYDALKLRRAEGKPLADILRSIKQALYSGEFTDTTGLAECQEVNAGDVVRYNKVYHGSGVDFDHFDHSHMGEGEGAQAFGWGTYVTEVEGIGRTYADTGFLSAERRRQTRRMETPEERAVSAIIGQMLYNATEDNNNFERRKASVIKSIERAIFYDEQWFGNETDSKTRASLSKKIERRKETLET